jgi:hypothetical protein
MSQIIGSKDFAAKFFTLKILAGLLSAKWLKAKIRLGITRG